MKNIHSLTVGQIRIFPEDTIPYKIFSLPDKLKQLRDHYHFTNEEVPIALHIPGSPKLIIFSAGEAKCRDKSIIVDRIAFEDRKITLEVTGTSEEADVIFSDLANFINKMAGNSLLDEEKYLIKSEETKCIAELDIDYWDIFNERTKRFVKNNLTKMLPMPIVSIEPKKLSFGINFEQDLDLLQKQRIRISEKPFTIEPRTGIPFEDKVFYTESPCDSDTHLNLITTFESIFSQSKSRKKK